MLQAQTRTCIRRNAALKLYTTTTGSTAKQHGSPSPSAHNQRFSNHSVMIKPSDITSIADVYAIIRSVEAKFGKIQEFRPMRDVYVTSTYQHRIYAVFENTQSAEQVPREGTEWSVEVPPYEDKPGGLGLADFEHLLVPATSAAPATSSATTNTTPTTEEPPSWESVLEKSNAPSRTAGDASKPERKRKLTVSIKRSDKEFHTAGIPRALKDRMSPSMEDGFGRKFLAFSGFAPLKPITAKQKKEMKEETDDTFWMRRVTGKWAARTGLLDPGMQPPPPPSSPNIVEEKEKEKGGEKNANLGSVLEEILHPSPIATKPAEKPLVNPIPPRASPPTPTIALTPMLPTKQNQDVKRNAAPKTIDTSRPKPTQSPNSQADSSAASQASKRIEKRTGHARRVAEEERKKEQDAGVADRLKKMLGGWF